MLVKYYLSDSIKAPFEDFALGLRIVWASLAPRERERWPLRKLVEIIHSPPLVLLLTTKCMQT